jgi:hypothetical protein
VILRPDNHNHREQEYPATDVIIIGVVKNMRVDF